MLPPTLARPCQCEGTTTRCLRVHAYGGARSVVQEAWDPLDVALAASSNWTVTAHMVMHDVLEQLHWLNAHGYAHLDVTARNIVVSPDGTRASLIDFDYALRHGKRACRGEVHYVFLVLGRA